MDGTIDFVTAHWPFILMAGVFWVVGHFMETSVFTKKRAYEKGKMQWFWWWGRESMELHPIVTGAVIGLLWSNPEHADPSWPWAASVGYFAGAGVVSLFGWLVVSKLLERFGMKGDFRMPGESKPPE